MRTAEDLRVMQKAPLSVKVLMTKQRIREWIREFGEDGVYVSFSGGKDSTVLLHIVREDYPNVKAVFCDTGLEYPEIKDFVKKHDNVDIIRPEMTFKDVITKHGYPLISKEISRKFDGFYQNKEWAKKFIEGTAKAPDGTKSRYCVDKWAEILDMDFKISDKCCNTMKKKPLKAYQKITGKKPIIATMACESMQRQQAWIRHGCNAFESSDKKSTPISFWTEQDVLRYALQNRIELAKPYGNIIYAENNEQYSLIDRDEDKLKTTDLDRTGCVFCGFGCHLEKQSRWLLLKETHPKLYNYCIGGGEYVNGVWKPNKKGLGMGHVFDQLNAVYGENFIKYK